MDVLRLACIMTSHMSPFGIKTTMSYLYHILVSLKIANERARACVCVCVIRYPGTFKIFIFLSHQRVAGCDVGFRIFVRPSVNSLRRV